MPLFSKKQSIFVLRGLIEALPLVLVLFSPVLGAKVGQPLILSLIVYAGLNRHNLKMPDRNGWLFLLLITQYLVFHMFLAIAGGENTEARQYVSTAGLWAQPLLGLPLMFVYATTYAGIRQTFRFIAPPATALNMLVIGVAYFLGGRLQGSDIRRNLSACPFDGQHRIFVDRTFRQRNPARQIYRRRDVSFMPCDIYGFPWCVGYFPV